MKIKTAELEGAPLDWAVAQCEKVDVEYGDWGSLWIADKNVFGARRVIMGDEGRSYRPSADWSIAGPIIGREGIALYRANSGDWVAQGVYDCASDCERPKYHGLTLLVAAMRCFVASKLGDEVEVPDELVKGEQ